MTSKKPRLSVIIVSDNSSKSNGWHDEVIMLRALSKQNISEPIEIVIADYKSNENIFPKDLTRLAPNTRVVFLPVTRSSSLKDTALPYTCGSLIAVFEADSPPHADWLWHTVNILDKYPDVGAVSGITKYAGDGPIRRAAGLIDRGFIEKPGTEPTVTISNNAAIYRRSLLEKYHFPNEENPFLSSRPRNLKIVADGVKLMFCSDAIAVHDFTGLRFLFDLRRNVGFADGRQKLLELNGKIPSPKEARKIKKQLAKNRLHWEWIVSKNCAASFVHWYDWPLVLTLLFLYRLFEWRGLSLGLSGETNLNPTRYR